MDYQLSLEYSTQTSTAIYSTQKPTEAHHVLGHKPNLLYIFLFFSHMIHLDHSLHTLPFFVFLKFPQVTDIPVTLSVVKTEEARVPENGCGLFISCH